MKNLCYNVIEKRKRATKNVSIFQTKERKSDANLTSVTRVVAKSSQRHGEEIKGKEGTKSDDSLPRSGAQSIKA